MDAPNPASHQIFVSYSRQDSEWARAFVDTLKRRGWSVFLDSRSIPPGEEWSEEIDAAIDAAKVVIALWSRRSVRSSYVIAEVARAVVRGALVPLSIDRAQAPSAFRRFQTQPMHVVGATNLPMELVATIETRLAADQPPPALSTEEQHLREELAQSAAFARERGVPLLALQTLLERLGEVDVAPEAVPARLESFVSEFFKLKTDLARATNADPDVATTQSHALDLLNAGDLGGARSLIDDALTRRREVFQQAALETATLLADRARIDELQVRYSEAIAAYEEAADLVRFDDAAVVYYLERMVNTLIRQGDEFGDNAALVRAVEMVQSRAMPLVSREHAPLDWAQMQCWLGSALQMLGQRDSSADRLRQAVIAHRVSLEERTRDRVPLDWALTQNNLGLALLDLNEWDGGTARAEEAVGAFRAALEERSRDRVPFWWASTQHNLGVALLELGRRERGLSRLNEAVQALQAALEERTRDRAPLEWASTQHNLGNALSALGERESGTTRLEEAKATLLAALDVRTRSRVPLQWALTQNSLGGVLAKLGRREGKAVRLEQAVAAFRAALEESTQDRTPLLTVSTQHNLGTVLQMLGEREDGTKRLEEAVVAYQAALSVSPHDLPRREVIQKTLDQTLALLAERSSK